MTTNLINKINQTELINHWNKLLFLNEKSINIVTDASTIIDKTKSVAANAIITYDTRMQEFYPMIHKPVSIKASNSSEAELISIALALETMRFDNQLVINRYDTINVFTDSLYCIKILRPLFNTITLANKHKSDKNLILDSLINNTEDDIGTVITYNLLWSNCVCNIFHIKAHTNNMNYIIKDFIGINGIKPDTEEMTYLTSIHDMIDSIAIKTNQNII